MSRSQFYSIKLFILRHAWLNLWDKHMTTGRINQVTVCRALQLHHSPNITETSRKDPNWTFDKSNVEPREPTQRRSSNARGNKRTKPGVKSVDEKSNELKSNAKAEESTLWFPYHVSLYASVEQSNSQPRSQTSRLTTFRKYVFSVSTPHGTINSQTKEKLPAAGLTDEFKLCLSIGYTHRLFSLLRGRDLTIPTTSQVSSEKLQGLNDVRDLCPRT